MESKKNKSCFHIPLYMAGETVKETYTDAERCLQLANGTDIVTVSKRLGHASVTTTESFYSHITEKNKARAADCIADVLIRKDKVQ